MAYMITHQVWVGLRLGGIPDIEVVEAQAVALVGAVRVRVREDVQGGLLAEAEVAGRGARRAFEGQDVVHAGTLDVVVVVMTP